MDRIDALSPAVKLVVHDYGWLTVKTLIEAGVKEAKDMKIVIKTILYEHSNEYRAAKDAEGALKARASLNPQERRGE